MAGKALKNALKAFITCFGPYLLLINLIPRKKLTNHYLEKYLTIYKFVSLGTRAVISLQNLFYLNFFLCMYYLLIKKSNLLNCTKYCYTNYTSKFRKISLSTSSHVKRSAVIIGTVKEVDRGGPLPFPEF